jgi:hypothetical protein
MKTLTPHVRTVNYLGNILEKHPYGRLRRRWKGDIKVNPKEVGCEDGSSMELAQNKKNVTMELKVIPLQEFQKCFQQWQHLRSKCISTQREYFRGDPSQ